MGTRLVYIRGNSTGVDNLPWRYVPIARRETDLMPVSGFSGVPAKPYYPIGFTAHEMMHLSWLIRRCKIEGSVTTYSEVTVEVFGGTGPLGPSGEGWTIQDTISATATLTASATNPPTAETDTSRFDRQEHGLIDFVMPRLKAASFSPTTATPEVYSAYPFYTDGFLFDRPLHMTNFDMELEGSGSGGSGGAEVGNDSLALGGQCNFMNQQPRVDGVSAGSRVPFPNVPQSQVYYDDAARLFYPYFRFSVTASGGVSRFAFGGGSGGYQFTLSSVKDPAGLNGLGGPISNFGTVTILGHTLDLFKNVEIVGAGLHCFNPVGALSGCDFSVTPIKWWPYSDRSGDSIYDEDTGAQINSPFD